MDRKYLFLNNDISSMVAREVRDNVEEPEEMKAEQRKWDSEAQSIIGNPEENINVDEILKRSTLYADVAGDYIKLFVNTSDTDQLKELSVIDAAAAMTLLPAPLVMAGNILINEANFSRWCDILRVLRYVPIQRAFCYNLRSHEDFLGVLKEVDPKNLTFPLTFLWSLLNHWLEWIVQSFVKLESYEDHHHSYDDNELAQSLKKEAQTIREEWERQLPEMIDQILMAFRRFFNPMDLLVWATKKRLRDDAQNNPYSKRYNLIIALICHMTLPFVDLNEVSNDDLNLNMLILVTEKAVEGRDESLCNTILHKQLLPQLLNENFTSIDKNSKIDCRRQRVIAKLLDFLSNSQNYSSFIREIAPKFEGWNLNYDEVYKQSNREAYMLCSLFRIFELKSFTEGDLFLHWKDVVDVSIREYIRCNNGFIKRDELCVPFRVAVEVAEVLDDNECRDYLHDGIISNVLSIVAILRIFSECSMQISYDTIKRLRQRIELEWPSAELLMEARGQIALKRQIQSFIHEISKSDTSVQL